MTDITVNQLCYLLNDETPANSRASRVVHRKMQIFHARRDRTARRQPRQIVLDQLIHVLVDCGAPNWDGYGALPVTREAILHARRLFERLDGDVDVPSVMGDPDGDVALEWDNGGSSLTIAVDTAGKVAYAGYFEDGATVHGTEVIGDSTVETIRRLIARVYRGQAPRQIA